MKELVERVARGLVDRPEDVRVEEFEEGEAIVYEVRVAQDDLGKVIGRQGKTVRALRSLLEAAGQKDGRVYQVEVME